MKLKDDLVRRKELEDAGDGVGTKLMLEQPEEGPPDDYSWMVRGNTRASLL